MTSHTLSGPGPGVLAPSLSPAPSATGSSSTTMSTLSQQEQVRQEFFRTYDVMTGIRIAATLGGFFGMMVLLVLYKSRCRHGGKAALNEVRLAAAKAAVDEEEQQEAVAAALYVQSLVSGRGPRRSLGNMSAPLPLTVPPISGQPGLAPGLVQVHPTIGDAPLLPPRPLPLRFSSLGGCNLLEPRYVLTQSSQRLRRASFAPVMQHKQRRHSHQLHLHPLNLHPPHPSRKQSQALGVIESSPEQAGSEHSAPASPDDLDVSITPLPGPITFLRQTTSSASPPDSRGHPNDGRNVHTSPAPPARRAPLARISTFGGSTKDGDDSHASGCSARSISDEVFAATPRGMDDPADTDHDADDQLSTDSDTPGPSLASLQTQAADVSVAERLYVLPETGCTIAAGSRSARPAAVVYARTRQRSDSSESERGILVATVAAQHTDAPTALKSYPRDSQQHGNKLQARPTKVFASLDSAASDESSLAPAPDNKESPLTPRAHPRQSLPADNLYR